MGLPDDVRATDHDRVRAFGLDAFANEHLLHPVRRRGFEAVGVAEDELAHVHRVEAVDVLGAG